MILVHLAFNALQYALYSELSQGINLKKNILISAGTSTGKTTFLNACLKAIPHSERILTIEDAREVKDPHLNRAHLFPSRGGKKSQSSQKFRVAKNPVSRGHGPLIVFNTETPSPFIKANQQETSWVLYERLG